MLLTGHCPIVTKALVFMFGRDRIPPKLPFRRILNRHSCFCVPGVSTAHLHVSAILIMAAIKGMCLTMDILPRSAMPTGQFIRTALFVRRPRENTAS